MRILVVDDNDMQRSGLAEMLEGPRYRHAVQVGYDGTDAVETFREALASGKPFDAVISDQQMSRMNGTELHAAIKAELNACRFVLMSGSFSDAAKEYAGKEGIPMFWKPLNGEDVAKMLKV